MDLTRQILAIGFVFLLLGGAIWCLRRKGFVRAVGKPGSRRTPRRLEAAERLALTPQHSLHLIRVANRTLLVGAHPQGLGLLASLPWDPKEGGE
jgi:flagellar biogenesis protein FliO